MTEHAYYREPTRRERMTYWLFPSRHVEASFPEWAGRGDVVVVGCDSYFSWRDRVRILITGWVHTEIRVTCELPVGRTVSAAESWPILRRDTTGGDQ